MVDAAPTPEMSESIGTLVVFASAGQGCGRRDVRGEVQNVPTKRQCELQTKPRYRTGYGNLEVAKDN
jgi:hypothetical protein